MGGCFSSNAASSDDVEEKAICEAKLLFTYENMVRFLLNEKDGPVLTDSERLFGANIDDSTFISFAYLNTPKLKDVGWKAHISISDKDISNIAKGWNLLKDIFIEEKLSVKVVRPHTDFFKDDKQHGKQVTMYCFMSMHKKIEEWEKIFNSIEKLLLENEIVSAVNFPEFNRVIPGSRFLSYKNDDDGKGNYIASPTSYNPSNQIDPFIQITLEEKPSLNPQN